MDYKKKMKSKIIMGVIYAVLGIALIISANIPGAEGLNTGYISSLGTAFTTIGIVFIVKYIRILRNPELLHKYEVAAKDERNIMLDSKARGLAFAVYVVCAAVAMIVCSIFYKQREAMIIGFNLCAIVFLYWICYVILSKKY